MSNIVKGEEGDFRGGDPEELQRKREEKREDMEASGELEEMSASLKRALAILKAEAGMEGGEFRGGDPEELQRKREEKREEMEASGEKELQEEEAALAVEAAGGEAAMAEEAEAAAEDESEKSVGPFAAFEVSPVDTLEDYRPRNWNGDPLDTQPSSSLKRMDPAPVRDEKTKHLPWSEVVGFKVPQEGAPWVYLRRLVASGQADKVPEESAKILKALDDILFNTSYRIQKGGYEEGSIVPGHKYIYRWKGKDGRWRYEYSDGVHQDHHGVAHTGITSGHSLEVHPDWHGKNVSTGQDPQLENPEEAFHHARQMALEEGGTHRVHIKNRDKWNPELGPLDKETGRPVGDYETEAHLLHLPGKQVQGRGRLQLIKDPTGGRGELKDIDLKKLKGKRWENWDQFEEHVRKQHVNTIFDVHGKPFVQWYDSKVRAEGKKQETRPRGEETEGDPSKPLRKQRGRIRMRYMPDSQFSREVQRKTGKIQIGKFFQRHESAEKIANWAEDELEDQKKEEGMAPPPKRLEPLKPIEVSDDRVIEHFKTVNALEQGAFPRKREEVPYMAPAASGEIPHLPSQKRVGTRKTWRVQWKDGEQHARTITALEREMHQLSLAVGAHIIDNIVNVKRPLHGVWKVWGKVRSDAIKALTSETLREVIWSAVNNYDPDRGERFAKFVFPKMFGAQMGKLKQVLQEAEGKGPVPTRTIEGAGERELYQQQPELFQDPSIRRMEEDDLTTVDPEDQAFDEALGGASQMVADAPPISGEHAAHLISHADRELNNFRDRLESAGKVNPVLKRMDAGQIAIIDTCQKELRDLAQGIRSGAKGPEDLIQWHEGWSDPESGYNLENTLPKLEGLHKDLYEHIEGKQEENRKAAQKNKESLERLAHRFGEDFINQDPKRLMWVRGNRPLYQRVHDENIGTLGELIQSMQVRKLSDAGYYGPQAEWERDLAHESGQTGKSLTKAQEEEEAPAEEPQAAPDASYIGRVGKPGSYRHYYEAGGNVVQGTNAPVDHEDHDPSLGEPVAHESEPTPEAHPNFFDEQGRKLHSPVPDDALELEDNPNYDPDKAKGNHWVKRYRDAKTGQRRHVYLHRDQVLDPKMQHNNTARYVDVQLPKIRSHYHERLLSDNPADRALGLFIALLDQAKLPAEFLQDLEVEDVKIEDNTVTFQLGSAQNRSVLDNVALTTLKELLEGKAANDKVFQINNRQLDLITLNRFMHGVFGISPTDLEIYNNTELFSREFQKLVQQKDTEYTVRHLREVRAQAAKNVAKMTGTDPNYVERNVDPIAVEALFLAAAANRHRIGKSKGWCTVCGEPVGHCPHSGKKNKLRKGYALQGRTEFQGLPISIENKKGSVRKWYDPHEEREGETKMYHDYGYIRGTLGVDKDHVDVYLGPNPNATTAFVVHQMKAPNFTKFDEDKVMLGWDSEKEAKAAYMKQYDNPGFFGAISAIPMEKFINKVKKTRDKPQMLKAHTWQVLSDKPERTAEEELFSQWLHDYPLHEHHVHWNALARQTHKDERERVSTGAPGGTHLPEMLEAQEVDPIHHSEAV